MILDGTAMGLSLFGATLDPREHLLRFYPEATVPPLDQVVRTAAPLVGRINHGIWIASCDCGAPADKIPTPGCVVFLTGPGALLGWCLRCQNGATGRGWRPITVPEQFERQQIEAVLLCRPQTEARNWEPSETIADLIAQNVEHGDPVPDLDAAPSDPEPDWREQVRPFSPLVRQARSRLGRLLRR